MQLKALAVLVLTASAGAIWGCSDQRSQLSPTSPSSLTAPSRSTRATPPNIVAPRLDSDGDGYDDGDPQMPSEPAPAPDPTMPTVPIPVPVQLTVNIVGTFGTGAFAPNPLQAAAGNTIVWTNSDVIAHAIVLDDGTPVGSLAPGQTSNAVTVTLPITGYHCLLHPSMVGQVSTVPPPAIPTDPTQVPAPDPGATPAPPPDPYGNPYPDYGDDYY